ncbi:MAG: hypothetical protein A2X48_23295 [Lentisphaerae bacterium GWF2_49_21]|nr:MAG: hypothetical protein A2X48_23295 [Lentisphaerae bacterium GWF2_49_21]
MSIVAAAPVPVVEVVLHGSDVGHDKGFVQQLLVTPEVGGWTQVSPVIAAVRIVGIVCALRGHKGIGLET